MRNLKLLIEGQKKYVVAAVAPLVFLWKAFFMRVFDGASIKVSCHAHLVGCLWRPLIDCRCMATLLLHTFWHALNYIAVTLLCVQVCGKCVCLDGMWLVRVCVRMCACVCVHACAEIMHVAYTFCSCGRAWRNKLAHINWTIFEAQLFAHFLDYYRFGVFNVFFTRTPDACCCGPCRTCGSLVLNDAPRQSPCVCIIHTSA